MSILKHTLALSAFSQYQVTCSTPAAIRVLYLYRYESNEITNLPISILEPLSKVLKTSPAYLMGWTDIPEAPSTMYSPQEELSGEDRATPAFSEEEMPHMEDAFTSSAHKVPLLGAIRAGVPILADGNVEDYLDIPSSIKADFALRVEGDSMIFAGILPDDIVLMKQATTAQSWDIVAAGIEEFECSANLKYYVRTNGRYVLRSANPEYEDIPVTQNHRIIGIMKGLIREGSPTGREYKDALNTSDRLSDEWLDVIIEAQASGLDAKKVKQLIEVNKALLAQLMMK